MKRVRDLAVEALALLLVAGAGFVVYQLAYRDTSDFMARRTISESGVLRREQDNHVAAESMLRQALEGRQRKLGPDHPACFESKHRLAVLYIQQARYEDAERLLQEAFHGREAKLGPQHPQTIDSLRELVNLYESWPKPDEVAKWQAKRSPKEAAAVQGCQTTQTSLERARK